MTDRHFRWWLLGIVLVALTLRLLFAVTVLGGLDLPGDRVEPVRSYDELYYVGGAQALADGDGFRFAFLAPVNEQAYLPPLTSVVLAPVALVTEALFPMRLVGVLGGTAAVALIGVAGRAVRGPRVGIIAATLAAIYPNLWMNDGLILAETWAVVATVLVLLATYRYLAHPSAGRAALIGLGCGVAMLTRGELALLVPLLAGYLVVSSRTPWRDRVLRATALVISAVVIAAPWVGYNLSRFERPVLLAHGDGDVLLGANCPTTYYGDRIGFTDGACVLLPEVDPSEDRSVEAAKRRDIAFEYIRENLSRVPLVVSARLGRVWSVYAPRYMATVQQSEGRPVWASYLGLLFFWGLVPLAVAGGILLRRGGRPLFPLIAPIILVSANAALFFGFVRYRISAEPALVLLAAVAIARTGLRHEPAS